jgi:hypothetical protein
LWPRERFSVHGVEYLTADKPKSDIYRDLLPVLNSSRVELLDHPRLVAQPCGLERRTARGGRVPSIMHQVLTMTSPTPSPVQSLPLSVRWTTTR